MKGNKLKGIIPPIVTPVGENEDVDEKGLRKLIDHCIGKGLHGIFVAGTNGEALSLTQSQRNAAVGIALDEAAGRVPVLAGVMDSSTRRVIENIKAFEQMGGEYAVVTPVFYAKHSSPKETVRHFEEISRNTECKILVYNIPIFTGTNVTPDMVEELSRMDKIVGLKDSSGNFSQFLNCLNRFRNTAFAVFQGLTDLAGASILLGADGLVLGLAPLFPELHLDLYHAALAGNIGRTIELSALAAKTTSITGMSAYSVSAVKYALSTLGFMDKRMIRPSEPVKAEEEERIKEIVLSCFRDYDDWKKISAEPR